MRDCGNGRAHARGSSRTQTACAPCVGECDVLDRPRFGWFSNERSTVSRAHRRAVQVHHSNVPAPAPTARPWCAGPSACCAAERSSAVWLIRRSTRLAGCRAGARQWRPLNCAALGIAPPLQLSSNRIARLAGWLELGTRVWEGADRSSRDRSPWPPSSSTSSKFLQIRDHQADDPRLCNCTARCRHQQEDDSLDQIVSRWCFLLARVALVSRVVTAMSAVLEESEGTDQPRLGVDPCRW